MSKLSLYNPKDNKSQPLWKTDLIQDLNFNVELLGENAISMKSISQYLRGDHSFNEKDRKNLAVLLDHHSSNAEQIQDDCRRIAEFLSQSGGGV
jgi:hypothetical protein